MSGVYFSSTSALSCFTCGFGVHQHLEEQRAVLQDLCSQSLRSRSAVISWKHTSGPPKCQSVRPDASRFGFGDLQWVEIEKTCRVQTSRLQLRDARENSPFLFWSDNIPVSMPPCHCHLGPHSRFLDFKETSEGSFSALSKRFVFSCKQIVFTKRKINKMYNML